MPCSHCEGDEGEGCHRLSKENTGVLVEEVTLDFSDNMHQIVCACFPQAMITLDRFHHQQFCLEVLQEIHIGHCREVMTKVAIARDDFMAMIKDLIKSGKSLVQSHPQQCRITIPRA